MCKENLLSIIDKKGKTMEIVIKQNGTEKVVSFDKKQRSDLAMRDTLFDEGILGIFPDVEKIDESSSKDFAYVQSEGQFVWGVELTDLSLPRIGYPTSETNLKYYNAVMLPCFEARIMEGSKKRDYLDVLISEYQRIETRFVEAKSMALENIIRVSNMPDDGKALVQIDWSSSGIGEALDFPEKAFIVE